MRNAKRKWGFTLIELVTVIAIAAIMMTLIGMAFEGLGSGNKVNQAAAEVGNALNWAKSQAASRRQYIAVIFLEKFANNADVPKAMKVNSYAGFRLAVVERPTGKNNAKFLNWVPNSDWTYLPKGTFLSRIWKESSIDQGQFVASALDVLDGVYKGKDTDCSKALITVNEVEIRNKKYTAPALVFGPRGTVVPQEDLYIVVGECTRNIENDPDPAKGDRIQNSRELKVNKFTGVISYE